jgi:amidase
MPPHEINLTSSSKIQTTDLSLSSIVEITNSLGVSFSESELPQWHKIIGSIQRSIDDVSSLPDYVPKVDTIKYPRKNIHRPRPEDNSQNRWAWKVEIDGANEGCVNF